MGLLIVDLNNVSLDNNFDDDYPETIINFRPMAWRDGYKQRKAY